MVAIALWAAKGLRASRLAGVLSPVLLLVAGLAIVDGSGVLPEGIGIRSMILERTVEREYLADMPEIEAKQVLAAHPQMLLCGTGLGGMSFYIAQNIGSSTVILFPNTGLLAYICNMGLIGIGLMIISLWAGLRPTLIPSTQCETSTRALSFIGTVCLMQTFIFNAGIGLFALAFLFAAEFRLESFSTECAIVLRLQKKHS